MERMPSPSTTAFASYLRSELARRCNDNPSYSLRAFARDLGVDHATLSQLLRGSRTVTRETAERLGVRLGLTDEVLAAFSADARPRAEVRRPNLAIEAAAVILDPLHAEVLSLVDSQAFQADSTLIARVLDVDVDRANVVVQRLLAVGLLEMSAKRRWTSRLPPDLDRPQRHRGRHLARSARRAQPRAALRARGRRDGGHRTRDTSAGTGHRPAPGAPGRRRDGAAPRSRRPQLRCL
jgi:transcriptional regulator with XRE-family HTH domain